MKVLSVHNYPGDYATGGEGNVFRDEAKLLRENGHEVKETTCTNADYFDAGILRKARAFANAPWSRHGYDLIRKEIRNFQPDIMHVHNFFFVLSPSIFRAAKDAGVPTVTTLHNYRLVAPCSQLLLKGRICKLCVGRNPWRILLYRCYRPDFLPNLLRYRVYYSGKLWHRWLDDIDAFISLSEFAKELYVTSGIPADRIHVKANSIPDPLAGGRVEPCGDEAVFVGRLSREKGILPLLQAWRDIEFPLLVVGGGPLMDDVRSSAPDSAQVLGEKKHEEAIDIIKRAAFIVFPSLWFEGFPLSLVEAMAIGRAVVASDLGARAEVVKAGKTGLLFKATDQADLTRKIRWMVSHPRGREEMGRNAREEYLSRYQMQHTYSRLIEIYGAAMARANKRGRG